MKNKGFSYAIIGCVFWGLSGIFAQTLFTKFNVQAPWLVGVRLLSAGSLLVIWSLIVISKQQWQTFLRKKNIIELMMFALFGVIPSQLTYLLAIQYGNASTATILQFTGPLFIILYLCLRNWVLPRRIDVISLIIALLGTVLVVTNGNLTELSLSLPACFWGIMAVVSQTSYTLLPRRLLREFDARIVIGLAMIVGGIFFIPVLIFIPAPQLTLAALFDLSCVVVIGTMFSYLFYLQSLKFIPPETTGMLSAFEPLTATLLSILWLHQNLGVGELIGACLIISTTFLQSLAVKLQRV